MNTQIIGNAEQSGLTNQLLVSMPQLHDANFSQTVTLICKHDHEGAMGIVLNRTTEYRLSDIFSELSLKVNSLRWTEMPVLFGGPVSPELGLVVHPFEQDCIWESTMEIGSDLFLTSSRDILQTMASGKGPAKAIMSLGYAGWGPGQLELEIQQNAWFSAPPDHCIIFGQEHNSKWQRAAKLLGIDVNSMSTQVGHA